MFLLFLIQCVRLSTAPVIYIPICFYYFKQIVASLLKESKIYIPICFYYFDISNGICCSVFLIYIPICLLFRRIQLFARNSESIYIPICFYYFKSKRSQERQTHLIYIPICFYYFLYSSSILFCKFSFTFQYVSIISVMLIWYSIRKY